MCHTYAVGEFIECINDLVALPVCARIAAHPKDADPSAIVTARIFQHVKDHDGSFWLSVPGGKDYDTSVLVRDYTNFCVTYIPEPAKSCANDFIEDVRLEAKKELLLELADEAEMRHKNFVFMSKEFSSDKNMSLRYISYASEAESTVFRLRIRATELKEKGN